MNTIPFVDLAAQHRSVQEAVADALDRTLSRTDWVLGPEVDAFEAEFAVYCGAAGAVGTDSGMSALELALLGLGVGPGDEVITAANTFVATALAISHVGATPVLVDVDPERYTLDPARLEAAITGRTRAIMPVHLYGQPADMDEIMGIAAAHDLAVVEDACQAHGARYRGRRAGSLGHAAAFSFYPSKNLGAYGDGGIVVSNDESLLERLRVLRNYGQAEKYRHVVKGFNRRLDTLQAAILRVKLARLDGWNDARRRIAARYERGLAAVGIAPPRLAPDVEGVWHLYVIELDGRDEARAFLAGRGIQTGIHYPIPVHLQPAYADLGRPAGSFPVSERAAGRILSLPMYPEMPLGAVDEVVAALGDFVAERRACAA